jgi:hypothetical protein
MTKKTTLLYVMVMMSSLASYGQTNKAASDYLNLPGPVLFDGKSYKLAWSSHPAENYYKQEYLTAGDELTKFNTMLMVELVTDNGKIKEVAGAKVAELKKMQESNPMIYYESFENPKTGEVMIDFLLTQNNPDGKSMSIAERNVYRYMSFIGKSGQKGSVLFGVSTRSYGNNIDAFLVSLKGKRKELVNKVAQYKFPELKIIK